MGYCYGPRGICCDRCGVSGGVRRRACPHKVRSGTGPGGTPTILPYCSGPALCGDCLDAEGGTRKVHAGCAAPARAAQARDDARQVALEAGAMFVTTAWGSWADGVPDGCARVEFRGRAGTASLILPADVYRARTSDQYADLVPYAVTDLGASTA